MYTINNTIIQILKYSAVGLTLFTLSGCSSLMPYQEESACRFNGLGKCLSIDKAYKEAVTGIDQGGNLVNGQTNTSSLNNLNADNQIPSEGLASSNLSAQGQANERFFDLFYKKTKALINQSNTPLLKPAVVRRVLILPYTNQNSSQWFEPRYVYYIEDKPRWELDAQMLNNASDMQNQVNLFN